jgi:bifunctional UDP-N-acetylglucosamine pyrophosphorylase/glucosamine-1-phosphate N-acetyltransferase
LKAVILAAGKGTRLIPLTANRPKPLLLVGGLPLLDWMLIRVKEAGIKDVLIIANYLEYQIIERYGTGSEYGLNLSYSRQEEIIGTANAFSVAKEWVGKSDFIGLYSDHFISEGALKRLVKAHRKTEVTVSCLQVEDPNQFGVFELDGDLIKKVVEKPPKGSESNKYINVGIYVFPSRIFEFIKKTPKSIRGEYEITDTMQLMIDDGITLRKHEIQSKDWLDVGLPWMLMEANRRAMNNLLTRIEGEIEERVTINGPVWIKRGAKVRSGVYIEGPVIIGEDCVVGPNCFLRAGTCLGDGVHIGNACEVKNSVIMEGSNIAHMSYVGDSIIGSNCNLGAGTIIANLRFDKKNIKVNIKGERIDSGLRKLGAIIGDNVETGINVSIHPGVVIGNDVWIAPGVTIRRDAPNNVFISLKSESIIWPR